MLQKLGIDTDHNKVERFCRRHNIPAPPKLSLRPDAAEDAPGDAEVVPTQAPWSPDAGVNGSVTSVASFVVWPTAVVESEPIVVAAERLGHGWHSESSWKELPDPEDEAEGPTAGATAPAGPKRPPGLPAETSIPIPAFLTQKLGAHQQRILRLILAGANPTIVQDVLTKEYGVSATVEEAGEFMEGLVAREYPRGKIRPDLLHIQRSQYAWDDNAAVVQFSSGADAEPLTLRQLYGGLLVTGGVGSGKTSGPAYTILGQFLQAGGAGLLMVTKASEAEALSRLIVMANRCDDIKVITFSGLLRINILQYIKDSLGAANELVENVVSFIRSVGSVAAGNGAMPGGDSSFWQNSLDHHVRMCTTLIDLAGAPISFDALADVTNNAPLTLQSAAADAWPSIPVFGSLLTAAELNTHNNPVARRAYERVAEYLLKAYPGLAPNTRSCITQALMATLSVYRQAGIHEMLSTQTTWTPESCLSGSITVLDLSPQSYGEAGRLAQAAIKWVFQKAVLRRADAGWGANARPLVLYADECQTHLSAFDPEFQRLAREYRCCHFMLTQNLENFFERFGGGASAESKVHAILGAINSKIFMSNGCLTTTKWASELIGTEDRVIIDRSVTPSVFQGYDPVKSLIHRFTSRLSVSYSEKTMREPVVHPHEFGELQPGNESNGWIAEGIFVQTGRIFMNGQRYLRVRFQQLKLPTSEAILKESQVLS